MQACPFDVDEEWDQAGIIATVRTVIPPENEHGSLRKFGHIMPQGGVRIMGQGQESGPGGRAETPFRSDEVHIFRQVHAHGDDELDEGA